MRLAMQLSMDGAAFDNGPGPLEVSRILRQAADDLEGGWTLEQVVRLRDVNGNRVGFMVVTDSEGDDGPV